jgi:hypothetical protein
VTAKTLCFVGLHAWASGKESLNLSYIILLVNVDVPLIVISGATAQSWAVASLPGFVTVRYITMWVISPTINLVLVILIQLPETSSGETTTDI